MGKIKDFFKYFATSEIFNAVDEKTNDNLNKGINFQIGGVPYYDTNYNYIGNKEEPTLENLYNAIASQLSLLTIRHFKKTKKENKTYEMSESKILQCFGYRVNEKQTSTDFMHAFFYDVVKYGNGLAIIDPYYNGQYNYILKKQMQLKLINVNVSNCEFGFAYEEDNEENIFLVIKNKKNGKISKIDYKQVIHLRYKPQQIHMNEASASQIKRMVDLYEDILNKKLQELSNESGDKVVYKMRIDGQIDENVKRVKAKKVSTQISSNKVVAIDSGEGIDTLKLDNFSYDQQAIEDAKKNIYNFFGVNGNIINGDYTEEQFSAFFNNTIEPLATRFEEELQSKLLNFEEFLDGQRIQVVKTKIILSLNQFLKYSDKLLYNGTVNNNETRDVLGLDPIDGGEVYYTNANAVQLGAKTQNDLNEKTLKGGD